MGLNNHNLFHKTLKQVTKHSTQISSLKVWERLGCEGTSTGAHSMT